MNKKIQLLIFTALILFLITACLSCSSGSNDDAATTTTTTIAWQTDADGFLQYSTNDTALYSTGHYHTNNTIQTTMTAVEAQVKRISGYSNIGYGICFCYQDSGDSYRVLITTTGAYIILKRISGTTYYYSGGSWTTTNPSWPSSSHLNTGFNTINDIKVINNGSGNFDIYFNGVYETSFTDTTLTGGDSGYYATVSDSSHENFPSTPADMRFKQIDPDLSTAHSVQRILWQDDGAGFVQFSTNDTNDCGYLFTHAIGSPFTPMSSVEIQVKKVTGSSNNSHGILFCYQDDNNFYRIGITVNGYYTITKKVSGILYYNVGGSSWSTTDPSSWPISSHLNTGFDITNNIKIINNGSGNFDVYFNDIYETSFTDTTFTGGYNGYYDNVGTVSQENFPTPEDVRVKLLSAD